MSGTTEQRNMNFTQIVGAVAYAVGMKLLLMCSECKYWEEGSSEKKLMNNIIMWNHVKKVHPNTADRIMRIYKTVPDDFYGVRSRIKAVA